MAERDNRPNPIRAIEERRGTGVIVGHLSHNVHCRLRPNYGVAGTISLFFEENLCYRLSHQVTEDAEVTPGDNRTGTILVADRNAMVHEHSRNLDHFMTCHERVLHSSHYWSDDRYNYLYVAMGGAAIPGLLRVPDIRFCQDPRAARLEFHEIPSMVSTQNTLYMLICTFRVIFLNQLQW